MGSLESVLIRSGDFGGGSLEAGMVTVSDGLRDGASGKIGTKAIGSDG